MDLFADLLIVLGALWFCLAALGMLRFHDTLARMHAATKASTLGVALVVCGTALRLDGTGAVKAVLAIALAFLTIPVGSHLVGRAVWARRGDRECPDTGGRRT